MPEPKVHTKSIQSSIKPFTRDDIPQVARLIIKSFSFAAGQSERYFSDALEKVIFQNPWADESLPSLVYQHTDGTVKGFMGVSPRTMAFNGEPVTMAITHNFTVEPGPHSFLTGIKLYKSVLEAPQDLIISGSAGDASKLIAEKTGGTIGYIHSNYWRFPLRAFQCGLNYLGNSELASGIAAGFTPLAYAGDLLLNRLANFPCHRKSPEGKLIELTADDLVTYQNEFSVKYSLRPAYTPDTLRWVLDTAGRARHLGTLKSMGVLDANGNVAGWFILFLKPGGTCEVLQLKARKGKEAQVFSHLVYYTWKERATDLTGRLEPEFIRPVSQSRVVFRPGRMWMLLQGKRTDIISAICRNDAFLSRLEDDIWLL